VLAVIGPAARSNADKRATVDRALCDPVQRTLSDRALARRCGVSHELVARRRAARSGSAGQTEEIRIAERAGQAYAMRTAAINERRQAHPDRPYGIWTQRLRRIRQDWEGAKADLATCQRDGQLLPERTQAMESVMALGLPFAPCPSCTGVELGCADCGGAGWLPSC
jgi:hypothetical protein